MDAPVVAIWVEGITDAKFIGDLLGHLDLRFLKENIRTIGGGVTKLHNIAPVLSEFKDKGVANLVVLDANGDFDSCSDAVEKAKAKYAFDDYFLLPNHRDSGCLEMLLESIAADQHRGIFECFDAYEKCIRGECDEYDTPNRKAKIYAYCEALKAEVKEGKRNYRRAEHWNLDSPILDPLKEFLRKYLP